MKTDTMESQLANVAALAARDWYRQQCRNLYGAFYLWHRRAKPGESMALPIVSEEAPNDEYELSSPERISPAWDVPKATAWIRDTMRHLPIMGEG